MSDGPEGLNTTPFLLLCQSFADESVVDKDKEQGQRKGQSIQKNQIRCQDNFRDGYICMRRWIKKNDGWP